MNCKQLVSGAFRNHAIFAKPICKGSGCTWCTYHRTLRKVYNMYTQPLQLSKLFTMQTETTDYCCQNFIENQS